MVVVVVIGVGVGVGIGCYCLEVDRYGCREKHMYD